MTRRDQKRIVREMTDSIRRLMTEKIDAGKVPGSWDGIELRQWFSDISRECIVAYIAMIPGRLKDYRNDRLVRGI